MQLVAMTQDDVYDRWDWMRVAVLKMIAKTAARYRPEDVYLRLRGNTAWAYAFRHKDRDVGLMVLTQEYDPDGLVLFVWILWAEPNALVGHTATLYAETEKVARSIKAKRIRMHSPREGWKSESFFRQVAVVYEHEVTT